MFSKTCSQLRSLFLKRKAFFNGKTDHLSLRIKRDEILSAPSTPLLSPSYPAGPYRFIDREYMIISYETDPEALRRVVPAPLTPSKDNVVLYEWINMPDSYGFGSYSESGTVIPCEFNGEPVNFTLQMYLDNEPPISAGREIWGFPKKFGRPQLITHKDTLVGKLSYSGEEIAMGTMVYKYKRIPEDQAKKSLMKTQTNLKLIPGVDAKKPEIAQLIGYNLEDIHIKEAWEGPARLNLRHHVNAPTLRLPIKRIIGGKHIKADLTLPYGRVLHDYLHEKEDLKHIDWNHKEHPLNLDFSNKTDILRSLSMPLIGPSYTMGQFELRNRQHLVFRYKTNPEALARALPEPLIPNENDEILLVFTKTEGAGLGEYNKCVMYAPVYCNGELVHYEIQSYNDTSSSRTAGREIYGMPYKIGNPSLEVRKDTIVAKLNYTGEEVALGTMTYHHKPMSVQEAKRFLKVPIVNLKIVPGVEGSKNDVAKLTKYHFEDVHIQDCHTSPARLDFTPHVNAPLADFPVVQMLDSFMILADLHMSKGSGVYDYVTQKYLSH